MTSSNVNKNIRDLDESMETRHSPESYVFDELPLSLLSPTTNLYIDYLELAHNRIKPPILEEPKIMGITDEASSRKYLDRRIVMEFCELLDRAKTLFSGLRDFRALPQFGNTSWRYFYSTTFEVYSRLWKYQQKYRAVLNEIYGLERWQIGEIASKIGQLYFNFYLRTSQTSYLSDAFEFYSAIRERRYYARVDGPIARDLMIKNLRYYARFLLVALLMKRLTFVKTLLVELDVMIREYGFARDPRDQAEWHVLSDDVKDFLIAESIVQVHDSGCKNDPWIIKNRLQPWLIPSMELTPHTYFRLQRALIIGSGTQPKISEMNVDMFRIIQVLERESTKNPHDPPLNPFAGDKGCRISIEKRTKEAPEKYTLYKPSPTQALVYMSSACDDLSPIGVLLVYVSADGAPPGPKAPKTYTYDTGGLITTSKRDIYGELKTYPTPTQYKEIQCLHPGDLHPFTRRPMFLIVESDSSLIFSHLPRLFEMPLVVLMSPEEVPLTIKETRPSGYKQGGLLTLFLYSPLMALCYICNVHELVAREWETAQNMVTRFLQEALHASLKYPLHSSYLSFIGDDYLRSVTMRYIFCGVALRLHRAFTLKSHMPQCDPPIPEEFFSNPRLNGLMLEIVMFLRIWAHFPDAAEAGPSH